MGLSWDDNISDISQKSENQPESDESGIPLGTFKPNPKRLTQGALQGRLSKIQGEAWWELQCQGMRGAKEGAKKVEDSHGAAVFRKCDDFRHERQEISGHTSEWC